MPNADAISRSHETETHKACRRRRPHPCSATALAQRLRRDRSEKPARRRGNFGVVTPKADRAGFDRLLADEFAGVSPTAHYYNKDAAIEDLKRGTYQVQSMDLDEVSVNTYGDVAVAFASQEEKSRYAGTDISGHYHYTNVWVNRDGRWQAVASHGTRFDKGH